MFKKARLVVLLSLTINFMAGCGTVGYYTQAVGGHVEILRAAKPIDVLLTDPDIPHRLRNRLGQIKRIRDFASRELGLPDNASYRSYADIKRPFAVWNVFATPELSLKLMEWCHPVTGCVTYRGYYTKEAAEHYANNLRDQGWDVQVSGVQAYSTLGYTADPVLSTFVNLTEGEVARLIFHELAHQLVYVAGDTRFNESFATAVEEEGVRRWLAYRKDDHLTEAYHLYAARKKAFLDILARSRQRLEHSYAEAANDAVRRAAKKAEFALLRTEYAKLRKDSSHPFYQYAGYDRYFVQELNNAHLAAIATYTHWLPFFEQLLQSVQGSFPDFYGAVKQLAVLPAEVRDAHLRNVEPFVKIHPNPTHSSPGDGPQVNRLFGDGDAGMTNPASVSCSPL